MGFGTVFASLPGSVESTLRKLFVVVLGSLMRATWVSSGRILVGSSTVVAGGIAVSERAVLRISGVVGNTFPLGRGRGSSRACCVGVGGASAFGVGTITS